jgi:hypothetical protein
MYNIWGDIWAYSLHEWRIGTFLPLDKMVYIQGKKSCWGWIKFISADFSVQWLNMVTIYNLQEVEIKTILQSYPQMKLTFTFNQFIAMIIFHQIIRVFMENGNR